MHASWRSRRDSKSPRRRTRSSPPGQYPAIVACDYADGWVNGKGSTTVSTYCNGYLKEAWSKGSLPSVSVHAPNPGGGSMNVPLADFSDLTNPATPAGKAWHSTLDKVAAGLYDGAGFYPGSSYVDVVGLDCYISDPMAAQG
ncbi:glycosyl hydrolase [Streptomyces sp. NPDC060031]|uniref:glycosyl hydrolase n=1 Tax=Streptomyces sp. NPDC060031 TaxID=3347043 RepID=UPI0036BC0FD0